MTVKRALMNISHFCFILFILNVFGEIVTTGTLIILYRLRYTLGIQIFWNNILYPCIITR